MPPKKVSEMTPEEVDAYLRQNAAEITDEEKSLLASVGINLKI